MTESSQRLIVPLKLVALADMLAAWVGWHCPESGFDPVEWSLVIWLIGGLVGLAGSLAP